MIYNNKTENRNKMDFFQFIFVSRCQMRNAENLQSKYSAHSISKQKLKSQTDSVNLPPKFAFAPVQPPLTFAPMPPHLNHPPSPDKMRHPFHLNQTPLHLHNPPRT